MQRCWFVPLLAFKPLVWGFYQSSGIENSPSFKIECFKALNKLEMIGKPLLKLIKYSIHAHQLLGIMQELEFKENAEKTQ